MSYVYNIGVKASAHTAELIDELVNHHINNNCWPRQCSSSKLLHDAIRNKLVVICTNGDIAVLLRGFIVSSWWPVIQSEVKGYWNRMKSAPVARDRSVLIEFKIQPNLDAQTVSLFIDLVQRHHWFGFQLKIERDERTIQTSIPSYIERCLNFSSFEQLLSSVPEISVVYDRHHTGSNITIRTHAQIRVLEQKCLRNLVEEELAISIPEPFTAPMWLRKTIGDYIDEADIALRGGSPFAASIVYAAAIEACLTSKYSALPLPPDSPASLTHEQLHKLFKIGKLLEAMSNDIDHNPEMLKRLRFARKVRNGIHGNLYSECSSSVGVGDALVVRKTLRDLSEWVNTC